MLEQLAAAKFGFTLKADEDMVLPKYKGSMLRGGFGHVFKRICCVDRANHRAACGSCMVRHNCPYALVFEPSPPKGARHFGGTENIPRPYIFEPPLDSRTLYQAGEGLSFHLVLIGYAIDFLPYFVYALKELGNVGIGAGRATYTLQTVESVDAFTGARMQIYSSKDAELGGDILVADADVCHRYAQRLPDDRLKVTFTSPARIKLHKRFMFDAVPFEAIVQSLSLRLNTLHTYYCGGAWESELRLLRYAAKDVSIESAHLTKRNISRYSSRRKEKDSLSGVIGTVMYAGDLTPFALLLAMGTIVHVGSDIVFGCGQFELAQ